MLLHRERMSNNFNVFWELCKNLKNPICSHQERMPTTWKKMPRTGKLLFSCIKNWQTNYKICKTSKRFNFFSRSHILTHSLRTEKGCRHSHQLRMTRPLPHSLRLWMQVEALQKSQVICTLQTQSSQNASDWHLMLSIYPLGFNEIEFSTNLSFS